MNKNLLNGVIKSIPKKWTSEKIKELLELKKTKSIKEIASILDRTEISVRTKLKRLKKTNDTYNDKHREDKYNINRLFLKEINPKSILDVYAGNSFYKNNVNIDICNVIDNDINRDTTDYKLEALDLLYKFKNKKFDLVDLDPYGSAFDCFDLALKIATKGIVITFGEYGHKRWRRSDYVRHRYNIRSYKDFNIDSFNNYIINRAKIYNKDLSIFMAKDYTNICRTHFHIREIKKSVSGKEYYG